MIVVNFKLQSNTNLFINWYQHEWLQYTQNLLNPIQLPLIQAIISFMIIFNALLIIIINMSSYSMYQAPVTIVH